jgi:hypothetical protein
MSRAGKGRSARRLAFGVASMALIGAMLAVTLAADPSSGGRPFVPATSSGLLGAELAASSSTARTTGSSCGGASASTIAGVDAVAAQGIYAGELKGSEVSADIAHVTGSQALLAALAGNNRAAVYAAVHAIVYAPRWHIVRLRVMRAGGVIADVGGPDVIAPVSGPLRFRGRTVGSYVMSVQDDAGYVKLVSRFIGVPIDLYSNGSFLMGTLRPAPAMADAGTSLALGGSRYHANLLNMRVFPSGTLRVALLIASPSRSLATMSCASLRLVAWSSIAMRIAARLSPLPAHYRDLVKLLQGTSGGLVYVQSGSSRIAGGAGPARLPNSGTVKYAARSWPVFSWEPVPSIRVYFLTPAA